MSEAFCLYEDRERFQPYEKHHSTVLDAARLAEELRVRNLIIYHTEDRTLDTRRERYTAEARTSFSGGIWVPDDLERIVL
jgi:ribonuclease Z